MVGRGLSMTVIIFLPKTSRSLGNIEMNEIYVCFSDITCFSLSKIFLAKNKNSTVVQRWQTIQNTSELYKIKQNNKH